MIARSNASASPTIGIESNGMLMSPDEFDAVGDYNHDYRYELVHGVLVVNPIPSLGEVGPNELLGNLLYAYQQYHEQGKALDATWPERYIRLSDSRRRADRVIYVGLGRMPNEDVDLPAIAVEFVSRARRNWIRDYERKRKEYEAVGLKEYWVIDRFERAMTVYRFQKRKTTETTIHPPEIYATPLLPGFELKLAQLFDYADEVTQANPRPRKRKKKP